MIEWHEMLFPPGALIEVRVKDHDEPGTKIAAREWVTVEGLATVAEEWDDGNHHIWFGPAPRRAVGAGSAADCLIPHCFWVDIDPEQGELSEEYVVRSILPKLPPVNLVVHSGRGAQLYWSTDGELDQWDQLSRGFTAWIKHQLRDLPVRVDSTFDRPRMMRLPGTTNPKNGRPCHVIDRDLTCCYNAEQIPTWDAPRESVEITGRLLEGGRNNALWHVGSRLKWAGLLGAPLHGALHALNQVLCDVPLPSQEVDGIVTRLNDPRSPQPITADIMRTLRSETDVAALAAEHLADEIMSVRHGGRVSWYAWSDAAGVWVEGPVEGQVRQWIAMNRDAAEEEEALRLFNSCLGASRLKGIVAHMASNSTLPTYLDCAQLDSFDDYLPLRNGYLNLRTNELIPPEPSMRFTRRAEVSFDPDAKCPRWMRWLEQMVPHPDEREFLGKCFFYCLTGHNNARAFFVNLGCGRNGKSVGWELLGEMLGSFYAPGDHRVVTKGSDSAHDAPVAGLAGLRMTLYDELDHGDELNAGQVKRLTGGLRVRARAAYAPRHEDIKVTAKQVLVSNHRPKIQGEDMAVGDRLRYIQWRIRLEPHQIDEDMRPHLLEERDGILQWILSHGPAYWADRKLTMPERLAAEAKEYMEDENEMLAFVRTYIAIPSEPTDAVWADGAAIGRKWAEFTGEKLHGRAWAAFYRELIKQIELEGGIARVSGTRTKRLLGVALVDEGEKLL